jgi:hypothetical protein
MKIQVIENGYYVSEDLTDFGMVGEKEFEMSFSHLLVKGDVWEKKVEDGFEFFECVDGKWKGESNDGWWDFEDVKKYFKEIN